MAEVWNDGNGRNDLSKNKCLKFQVVFLQAYATSTNYI